MSDGGYSSLMAKGGVLLVLCCVMVAVATGATQIRKPTDFTDDGTGPGTDTPEQAFDFPAVYDQSTWALTEEPASNPSITWHTWNVTDVQVYEDVSLSITINASGFATDEWNFYYVTTSGTDCNRSSTHLAGTAGTLLSDNPSITNATVPLPRTQDLSQLQVCLTGNTGSPSEGGMVSTFDIRANGTVDTTAPAWRNLQQNTSQIIQGEPVELAAQGRDNANLSHATLATNETGTWENKTGTYSSPRPLYTGNTWTWSNVTWDNSSVTAGSTVGWRIWYNDTNGNHNVTGTDMFTLRSPQLDVTLDNPPTPFVASRNQTFLLNVTVICQYGDCGAVDGTARYNASSTEPDTAIPETDDTPFHTAIKSNPLTCDSTLERDTACNLTWQVNATGEPDSRWLLDVNVSSSLDTVQWNDTGNADIEISTFAIDIQLQWDVIDFGDLLLGEQNNPAANNTDGGYNLTVTSSTTEPVDLWTNMTDVTQDDGDDVIGATNMSVHTDDNPDAADPLSPTFSLLTSGVAPGTNVTTYYWLDTPLGIGADSYTGTLWVKANATA